MAPQPVKTVIIPTDDVGPLRPECDNRLTAVKDEAARQSAVATDQIIHRSILLACVRRTPDRDSPIRHSHQCALKERRKVPWPPGVVLWPKQIRARPRSPHGGLSLHIVDRDQRKRKWRPASIGCQP